MFWLLDEMVYYWYVCFMTNFSKTFLSVLVGLAFVMVGFVYFNLDDKENDIVVLEADAPEEKSVQKEEMIQEEDVPETPSIGVPLDRAKERVTKKPFGIRIDQATSPVQPERFSGYHTGVDFETFASEAMTDVPVRAICSGEVLAKRRASGYGGVLVTSCTLDGQEVTVTYGHLRLTSIARVVGERVESGDQIGVLGTGGSSETDGERKHLHLSIHRGVAPNILGYASDRDDLSRWLDPCLFVCQ